MTVEDLQKTVSTLKKDLNNMRTKDMERKKKIQRKFNDINRNYEDSNCDTHRSYDLMKHLVVNIVNDIELSSCDEQSSDDDELQSDKD